MSTSNNGPVHTYIPHPQIIANSGDNPVFFTDFQSHYEVELASHLSKQNEIPQQNFYYAPQQQMSMLTENHEVIRTVMDVGGGNLVVYGGRSGDTPGGIIPQAFHMVPHDAREPLAHPLGGFVPYHQPAQLIENLVGNWVPNQSGTYSPFGCADNGTKPTPATNQQTTQTVSDNLDSDAEGKGVGRNPRKTRIVAEVRPMRPSYSDVLTKSAPLTNAPSVPNSSTKQNFNTQNVNSNKSETVGNNGKVKNVSATKTNNKKSKNGLLKRQHSSGSDEHNGTWSAAPVKTVQSPLSSRKAVGIELKQGSSSNGGSLSRKWASLDDLDDPEAEGDSEVFDSEVSLSNQDPGNGKNDTDLQPTKKAIGVATPRPKIGVQNEEKWDNVGTTLNNHKQAAFIGTGKNPQGSSATKRPIHINNNLGTSQWASGNGSSAGSMAGNPLAAGSPGNVPSAPSSVSGEKNVIKGGSKACKSCSEEKKGGSSVRASSRNNSSSAQGGGSSEKAPQGKRGQRNKKKDLQSPILLVCRPVRQQLTRWGKLAVLALLWFLHLLSDVLGMSGRLFAHLCVFSWDWLRLWWVQLVQRVSALCLRVRLMDWLGTSRHSRKRWWQFWRRTGASSSGSEHSSSGADSGASQHFKEGFPPGLDANIPLPSTGEEAMKRLLACKGKDPYSILGVTPHSTDDDIKKYYKRQAFLVHPDKNNQPGAEEAFKILVHAFELIGEPERRKAYDHRVAETQQVEQAWSELSDLLSQLHQKMEYAANTIRCTNCGKRHRRISVDRPCYAARMCSQCKIHHAAREGDIWAESSMLGFLWHYYACMDGAVYDITEWAACQADNLRHLRANTHSVQYRIVLGRQSQSSNNHQTPPTHHHRRGGTGGGGSAAGGHRRSQPSAREPDLEDFLNNLYNHSGGNGSGDGPGVRSDQTRHRRKGKRKK
ncbi:DnaJ-like protein subfamily C member 14 [Gryllus bimaculatus]|nr:DnaJ-like protein subfamily C member 14 [Gryllus bimaculatus]